MNNQTKYEAVIFNSFEYDGETKWDRHKIANVKPGTDGKSFNVYIPKGLSISGRLVIQERQEKNDAQEAQQ